MASNYRLAQVKRVSEAPVHVPTWCLPPSGTLKLNVDASFLQGDLRVTCGVLFRDHAGQVVLSASQGFTGFMMPLHVELKVVLMG